MKAARRPPPSISTRTIRPMKVKTIVTPPPNDYNKKRGVKY